MDNNQQNEIPLNTGDNPIKTSRWAEASQNIDSPRFDPLEALSHLKIEPLQLDSKNELYLKQEPYGNATNRRRQMINDPSKNLTFDVHISNLNSQVNKHMIKNFFKTNPVSIIMNNNLGKPNAIVAFKTRGEACAALSLNGKIPTGCQYQTQKLTVSLHSNATPPLMDTPASHTRYQNTPNNIKHEYRGNPITFHNNDSNTLSSIPNTPNISGQQNDQAENIFNSRYSSPRESVKIPLKQSYTANQTNQTHQSSAVGKKIRVPLNLSKRTLPIEDVASVTNSRNTAIFGHAQPITNTTPVTTSSKTKDLPTNSNESTPNTTFTETNLNKLGEAEVLKPKGENRPVSPKHSHIDSNVSDSISDSNSIKKEPPQFKSFLHGGGSEIKRRINVDHTQASTSTKIKSNPYGEATPVDTREIEIRMEEKESYFGDSPQDTFKTNNKELDSKSEFNNKLKLETTSAVTSSPLLNSNVNNSSEVPQKELPQKNGENVWKIRNQNENAPQFIKYKEKSSTHSQDQFDVKNNNIDRLGLSDTKNESTLKTQIYFRDFSKENLTSNNQAQKFTKNRRNSEFRSQNKLESNSFTNYSSDSKDSNQLQSIKEKKGQYDQKNIKNKPNNSTFRNSSYLDDMDTNFRATYNNSYTKSNKFEELVDNSDSFRSKTFKMGNTGGNNLNNSNSNNQIPSMNNAISEESHVKTQNRYSLLNTDKPE